MYFLSFWTLGNPRPGASVAGEAVPPTARRCGGRPAGGQGEEGWAQHLAVTSGQEGLVFFLPKRAAQRRRRRDRAAGNQGGKPFRPPGDAVRQPWPRPSPVWVPPPRSPEERGPAPSLAASFWCCAPFLHRSFYHLSCRQGARHSCLRAFLTETVRGEFQSALTEK